LSWNNDRIIVPLDDSVNLKRKNVVNTGALIISNILYNNRRYTKLCISHNYISYDGVVAISNCLKNNVSLKELDMSYNEVCVKGAERIAEALQINRALQSLNISNCGIPGEGLAIVLHYHGRRNIHGTLFIVA